MSCSSTSRSIEAPCTARIHVSEELERVTKVFRVDPQPVVRARRRVRADPLGPVAEAPQATLEQVGCDSQRRQRSRPRPPHVSRAQRPPKATHEQRKAARIEGLEHGCASGAALILEQQAERLERVCVGSVGSRVPLLEPLELDIEITHGTERRTEPAEIISQRKHARRQHIREQRQRCPQAPIGDTHVVQFLDVVSQPRPRLPGKQCSELPSHDRERDLPDRFVRVDLGRPQVFYRRRLQASHQQPRLVLAQPGRLQSAGYAEPLDERLQRRQPPPRAPRPRRDEAGQEPHRTRDGLPSRPARSHRTRARSLQEEDTPAGAHLEQRREPLSPRDRSSPLPDRTLCAPQEDEIGPLQPLGHLPPPAQTPVSNGHRFEALQRRFRRARPTRSTNPQRIPGPVEAAILRVQVQIDLIPTRDRNGRHRAGTAPLRFLTKPPHHRTQVECVELPLRLRLVWHQPGTQLPLRPPSGATTARAASSEH